MTSLKSFGLVAAALIGLSACGSAQAPGDDLGQSSSALTSENGLTTNGLTTNGITTNGLTTNGLTTNGLTTNGLTTAALGSVTFTSWFALNPTYASMVMKYLVRCALPAGRTMSYQFALTTYSWDGELNLAPAWSMGNPIPVPEQQLVSACMAAHTNKYGTPVGVSVRGYYSNGNYISVSGAEQNAYPNDEGCFFGNLFDGTGVFSAYASDSPLVDPARTSLRACAINGGDVGSCAPMQATGRTCEQLCSGDYSDMSHYSEYRTCTWRGVSYRPISTRLKSADIATCGNGICEAAERCYDPATGDGCQADCGRCY